MSIIPVCSPEAADIARLDDPFVDGVNTATPSPHNAAAPEFIPQKHVMLLLVDSQARITIPGATHGIGNTCSVLQYCQNIALTTGKVDIPAGSVINFHSITPASFGMLSRSPTTSSASNLTQSDMAHEIQIASAQAFNAGVEVKTLHFEDFVVLNSRFFAGVAIPDDKLVDMDHLQVIVVGGAPIIFHYVVVFTYFPRLLDADFVRSLRDEFDALTIAVLLLAFYHDDEQRIVFSSAVDKSQLRALYALWLSMTPKIDGVLVDAVWDTLDDLVFNPPN